MMSRCLSCAGPDGFHEPHCQQERDTLRAENARLQARVEELEGVLHGDKGAIADQRAVILKLKAEVKEVAESRRCAWRAIDLLKQDLNQIEALAERRKKALPDPDKLRLLADWFDVDDAAKGRASPTLATLGGQPSDEIQQELRGWAKDIAAAIEEEEK